MPGVVRRSCRAWGLVDGLENEEEISKVFDLLISSQVPGYLKLRGSEPPIDGPLEDGKRVENVRDARTCLGFVKSRDLEMFSKALEGVRNHVQARACDLSRYMLVICHFA